MNIARAIRISCLAVFAVAASALSWAGDAAPQQPNIVVLYVDDMGYLPGFCGGGELVDTPHMDSLAASGMVFRDGYVSAPVCGPSRVGLMTGRYQARTGHDANSRKKDCELLLSETTLAERRKAMGYRTGIVGKWHLGATDERFLPTGRGFDFFIGHEGNVNEGSELYFRGSEKIGELEGHPVTSPTWGREAVAFIRRSKDEPFFLYLAFNAVHTPHVAMPETIEQFSHIQNEAARNYAALTREMDDAIGGVIDELAALGLEQNTLVFLISDNGKAFSKGYENDGLRGRKWYVFEGGIRVPFVVSWKGHIAPGQESHTPVIQLDVLPTAIAAAGGAIVPEWNLDGVNLLPILLGEKAGLERSLFWRFGTQYAIRDGDWKLVKALATQERPMLINLAADPGEQTDLYDRHPEIAEALQKKWDAWNSGMRPPRWIDNRWNRTEDGVLKGKK